MLQTLKKAVLFAEGAYLASTVIQRTALASFPRSGNTWLRNLIEEASGQPTGCVYREPMMPRRRTGIVVKTHELDPEHYSRAILILRNPFDAIESYYFYQRDVLGRPDIDWDQHVLAHTLGWREHTLRWLDATLPIHRVAYEQLHADPASTLAHVIQWLDLPSDPGRIRAAVEACQLRKLAQKHGERGSRFFRQGKVGQGLRLFTPQQIGYVNSTLADLLSRCGYERP